MKSNPKSPKTLPSAPSSGQTDQPPDYPAHDRTAALADGLRKSHREGDIRDREYARQMQKITQEAAE